ncbi:MAG: hypothetical protein R6W67_02440 [Bacteroidales bacterium]
MKKILPLLLMTTLLFSGCGSSKRQMQTGNYPAAVEKAVRELRRNPNNKQEAEILQRAYVIANDQDNDRIRMLTMENRASSYDEIYLTYKRLHDRQTLVRTVTPLAIGNRTVDFPYIDYMAEMVAAKRKAADFYYANGIELMKNKTRESYRQAFYQFIRVKEYVDDYPDIDQFINEAKYLGISRALVSVENKSVVNFPQEFVNDLLALDLPRLNSEWVEYHTEQLDPNIEYDYLVTVNIKNVAVSPDQTMQRDSLVKKEVEDGFTYLLDKNGNVLKDSLGNDIKTIKYKTLQCALIESIQTKACVIEGDVEVIQLNPDRIVKRDPIGAESSFRHVSARAIGDLGALNPEQLESTKVQAAPFPPDIEMVLRCSETLKMAIRGIMQTNRRHII